ncbi:MAG: energy transducer TonB [Bacteroidales bacterium]|nr:energy transducer TonB [Bacteroidales bacterium]
MTNKNKNKIYGIIGTVVFHAIVLVLLFTLCFRTPLPLPGEAGVEVNLGMYAQGMGYQSSQHKEPEPVKETPKVEEQKVEPNEVVEEEILSEDEEIPSLEKPQEEIEEKEEEPETQEEITEEPQEEKQEGIVPEEKPVVNQRAMFQAPKNNKEPSSEGDTQGEGIKGNPNGLKDIERYEGQGGSGGGPSYDLGGRGAKSIPSPSNKFTEEGTIVVDIKVDKEGRVVEVKIGKGTTIVDSSMREDALKAAKNSIFNKDENAPEIQSGTITYTYIIRQ